MMSEKEFDLRLKHIEERMEARLKAIDDWRDRQIARLFQDKATQKAAAEKFNITKGNEENHDD